MFEIKYGISKVHMKLPVDGEHCSHPTKEKQCYTITLVTRQCDVQITVNAQMNTIYF